MSRLLASAFFLVYTSSQLLILTTATPYAFAQASIFPPIFGQRKTAILPSEEKAKTVTGGASSTKASPLSDDIPSSSSSSSSDQGGGDAEKKKKALADLGFSFSPAGLLFPYHLGVASRLRDRRIITSSTPLGGSSAGALIAAMIGADMDTKEVLDACIRINDEWGGALLLPVAGQDLKSLLHRVLNELLPRNAHERLNARKGGVNVAFAEIGWSGRPRFFFRPQIISTFSSREDLIEVLLASCCVPLWFSGSPFITCRGMPAVDGFFAVPSHRFGCPYIPATRTVLVSPFPASSVRRGSSQEPEEEAGTEWLSPELAPVEDRASMRQLLRDALSKNQRKVLMQYYEWGRQDADRWIKSTEFVGAKKR